MNVMQVQKWLDDIRTHLGQTMPHAVCKKCNAKSGACDRCEGKGWLTKIHHDLGNN
jgi:excinuclease UvrABC ATPase subunit